MSDETDAELEARVTRLTRPVVPDPILAEQVVTRGELASILATFGSVITGLSSLSRGLLQNEREDARTAMDEVSRGLADIVQELRNLVMAPEDNGQ